MLCHVSFLSLSPSLNNRRKSIHRATLKIVAVYLTSAADCCNFKSNEKKVGEIKRLMMRCKFAFEGEEYGEKGMVRSREREREMEEELFNLVIDAVRGDYRLIR